ncbi:helix-turn-helix domain-containing protein [Chryseobacterium luquanense]|uniref:AraC family transcriptional regulator n=1 Tax=Chryseobacterium luquanense TaxID=2983766 RepID=A0ABT3XY76_9FLAO|nr:helix-turn-helix domain-containing protein [Chryseobacterium luquanense]MCX8530849.1 AraC family transcriptional regulator [Chryseobacterium luquanense]
MTKSKTLSLLFLMYHIICISQVKSSLSYQEIRKYYETKELNDETALPAVNTFIKKAKASNDDRALALGYRDAVAYSSVVDVKLKFADSTIHAALRTKNNDLISDAYLGKGILYSFNLKKYQPALDEFLKAYNYSRDSEDEYLKHKVNYHLGNVKSYLGYYEEAIGHFNNSINYFESGSKRSANPNTNYNFKKGYFNILHQMTICYRNLNDSNISDSLIELGINLTRQQRDFQLEYSYFLKCKGILYFHKNKPNDAIYYLNKALPPILKKNDFTWASVIYFYLGNVFINNGDEKKGIAYFTKIDSIFNKHQFIFPEVRRNYEFLIEHYKKENNAAKELYYTKQLLRADNIIVKDFKYLSKKIFREYDRRKMDDEKERLESSKFLTVIIALVVVSCTIAILIYRRHREKVLTKKYIELQERLTIYKNKLESTNQISEDDTQLKKQIVSDEKAAELAKKLAAFEEKNQFLQKNLTCKKLAEQFKTNTHYLSTYINEVKGTNFNKYLSELRIRYITNLLNSDRKYLNYKIDSLAAECGIASRQNFSDLFFEINGIRPTDFIKMRLKEINNN